MVDSPKNDALFMPSCYQHTDNLCMQEGPLVQNVSFSQAVWDWYVGAESIRRTHQQALPFVESFSPGVFTCRYTESNVYPRHLIDDCNNETATDKPCNTHCECN